MMYPLVDLIGQSPKKSCWIKIPNNVGPIMAHMCHLRVNLRKIVHPLYQNSNNPTHVGLYTEVQSD